MSRLLICGSRTIDVRALPRVIRKVEGFIEWSGVRPTIVHGGAPGADSMGGIAAQRLGLEVDVFWADWQQFGKSAGFRRNVEMADAGVDYWLAFVDKPLDESRGTAHMVRLLESRGMTSPLHGHVVSLINEMGAMR